MYDNTKAVAQSASQDPPELTTVSFMIIIVVKNSNVKDI